jgi:hypothetical protein
MCAAALAKLSLELQLLPTGSQATLSITVLAGPSYAPRHGRQMPPPLLLLLLLKAQRLSVR